jgi:hypothetical protein
MFSGTFQVWIPVGEKIKENLSIPKSPQAWAAAMTKQASENEFLMLTVMNSDRPSQGFVVGFSPTALHPGCNIQNEVDEQEIFGFYINAETARQLEAVFGLLATFMEKEEKNSRSSATAEQE